MSIILSKDEKILFEGTARISVASIIFGILTLVIIIGIFILFFVYLSSKKKFYITNKRVVITGFGGSSIDLPISKIESTQKNGKWILLTGSGGKKTIITDLREPDEFYSVLLEQIS